MSFPARYTSPVALLWAGMLLGVSFLATPVKFAAPSLTLPVALDVGRHTFALYNKVEWALLAVLSVVLLRSAARVPARTRLILIVIAALMALQTAWLLPVLDARVGMILAGHMPTSSFHHIAYAVADAFKLLGLLLIGKPHFEVDIRAQ